jgi:hypothetical protein
MTLGITHFSDVYKGNEATFDAMGQQLAGLAKQNYGKAGRGVVLEPRVEVPPRCGGDEEPPPRHARLP